MSRARFYKWRSKCFCKDASLMGRVKEQHEENRRLKGMCGEGSARNNLLKEALEENRGFVCSPTGHCPAMSREGRRREMAEWTARCRSASIAHACRAYTIIETCSRYRPKRGDENEFIAKWRNKLTNVKKAWGFSPFFPHLRTSTALTGTTSASTLPPNSGRSGIFLLMSLAHANCYNRPADRST